MMREDEKKNFETIIKSGRERQYAPFFIEDFKKLLLQKWFLPLCISLLTIFTPLIIGGIYYSFSSDVPLAYIWTGNVVVISISLVLSRMNWRRNDKE